MTRGFTFLLATIGLLAGLSLPAGYYKLAVTPDGFAVDGMQFAETERALGGPGSHLRIGL